MENEQAPAEQKMFRSGLMIWLSSCRLSCQVSWVVWSVWEVVEVVHWSELVSEVKVGAADPLLSSFSLR